MPTWGPHPDVPEPLAALAKQIPAGDPLQCADEQIQRNVDKLGAPFHAVYTAEQAQAYKPRLRAFEYMLDQLGCGPEDILHVSSSLRYDLMPAHDLAYQQGLRQPWLRAEYALLRLPRGHRHRRPGGTARRLKPPARAGGCDPSPEPVSTHNPRPRPQLKKGST